MRLIAFCFCQLLAFGPIAALAGARPNPLLPVTQEPLPIHEAEFKEVGGSRITPKGLRVTFAKVTGDGHRHKTGEKEFEHCQESRSYTVHDTQTKDAGGNEVLLATIVSDSHMRWSPPRGEGDQAKGGECVYGSFSRCGPPPPMVIYNQAAAGIPRR